jgi:hypothetical protein
MSLFLRNNSINFLKLKKKYNFARGCIACGFHRTKEISWIPNTYKLRFFVHPQGKQSSIKEMKRNVGWRILNHFLARERSSFHTVSLIGWAALLIREDRLGAEFPLSLDENLTG